MELLSRLNAHVAAALLSKNNDVATRTNLIREEAVLIAKAEELTAALQQSMISTPHIATELRQFSSTFQDATSYTSALIKQDIFNAEYTTSAEQYLARILIFSEALEQYDEKLLPLLDSLLAARITHLQQQYFRGATVAGPIFLILFLYFASGAYIAVMASIHALRDAADRISAGDFVTPIAFNARDELLQVANSFNDMRKQIENRTSQAKIHTQELEKLNQKLEIISSTDALTGIANRRSFDALLEQEWCRGCSPGSANGLRDDRRRLFQEIQ